MKFLGIVTARGGSKRIHNKNLKLLAGIPLIQYTFNAIKESNLLTKFIVSTNSDDIIKYSRNQGFEVPFKRPDHLATDEAKSIDVLTHAVKFLDENENYQPDYIIGLQPTSPLRKGIDIDNAIKLIEQNPEADSLVSVVEIPHNYNPYSAMKLNGIYLEHFIKDIRIYRSQDKPIFYARNGPAIFISSYNLLLKQKKIYGDKCVPYFMKKENSIDIDDDYDWQIAEFLIKKIKNNSPLTKSAPTRKTERELIKKRNSVEK